MDAIQISIITKEGIDIVASTTVVPGKGAFGSIQLFNLCAEDECPDTKFTGCDIDVENENDPRLKQIDEIFHNRMKADLEYFETELKKLGLTLATSDFQPCEGCAEAADCPDNWNDEDPDDPSKL